MLLADFFPPATDAATLGDLGQAIVQTLEMAFAGTILGTLVAVPLAVLSTSIVTGRYASHAFRFILAVTRTIPALLWVLFFIIMVGFIPLGPVPGALAGVLALAAYTIGYLGKLYYEAFEAVDPEVIEAVRSTGATSYQVARHAIIPETANALLSQLLFIFEYNVRASSILGLVGAGGIGFYLKAYFDHLQYDRFATALALLLIVVLMIDGASRLLRRRFLTTPLR